MLAGMFSCISRNSRTVRASCLLSLGALSCSLASAEVDIDRAADRLKFEQAVTELRSGAGPRYKRLRAELNDYPLALYLDALVIEGDLHHTKPDVIKAFLGRAVDSPVALRTLRSFVRHKVKDRHWKTVVDVTQHVGLSTELRCHRAHALLMTQQIEEATTLLTGLWSVGKSQIKACDPVFKAWYRHSGPSDDVVWQRALRAADARNTTLLRYLRKFASATLLVSLQDLGEIYTRPDRVTQKTRGSTLRQRDIAVMGVTRLARINPGRALAAKEALASRFEFTAEQTTQMHSLITRHSLFAQSAAPQSWITDRLEELKNDELTEIYLRSTLRIADWVSFRHAYEWLSLDKRLSDEWQYWRVIAAAPGEAEQSESILKNLAKGRGFHAYLAADILGVSLTLGGQTHTPISGSQVDRGVGERVQELKALGRDWEANTEFRSALDDPGAALILAELAGAQGWHTMAIEAAAAAQAWHRVDLRFPVIYKTEFEKASDESGLEFEQLLAVARRESALASNAVSEVGARGLMQLLPSTARLTARKHNYRYSRSRLMRPGYNTAVGALYYADLIARYDGNRVLALAAYNAGPNRVRRWTQGTMSLPRWVDTIPFKETREYVRAVLAYNVIYRLSAQKEAQMLTDTERDHRY